MVISKLTEMLRAPSAEVLAQRELEHAKRSLLEAQTTEEYARNMVVYHTERIKRLKAYVKGTT